MAELFAQSRRLLGPNRFFAGTGAVLDALLPAAHDAAAISKWRETVGLLIDGQGWPAAAIAVVRHASGTQLAFEAPVDQLETACDLNETAWQAAAEGRDLDIPAETALLRQSAESEREPRLRALMAAAEARGLPVFLDDDEVTCGIGRRGRTWPRDDLPDPVSVPWPDLADAPLVLVTGTNGKTTTVRLCARIAEEAGLVSGYNSTEGVVCGGRITAEGDYAGPAGARRVVRDGQVDFVVIEAARGGILRRGLAVSGARVAVVTNISPDHFGEYGIDGLEDLADAKLSVARALAPDGLLVVNGEVPLLLAKARETGCRLGLFSVDFDHPELVAHRLAGGLTCGVRDGRLVLGADAEGADLGPVAAMPLAVGGAALYNVANIAASALAGHGCSIGTAAMARTFAHFGESRSDNPGRLERWSFRGIEALLDYAHNPDGMRGLLSVAVSLRGAGRLGLIMGQAGNRSDQDIRDLAAVAASARPDRVILKDEAGYLRGRQPGEVPALLRTALIENGLAPERIDVVPDELDAALALLEWAKTGDVAVLSVHGSETRPKLRRGLDMMAAGKGD